MSPTFDLTRFQPSFTFGIVKRIKRIKIQSRLTKMNFGLSVSGILMLALLSLALVLPVKAQVSGVRLFSVDVMKIIEPTIYSNKKIDRDFGQKPNQQFNQFNGSSRQKKVLKGVKPAQGDSTFIGTLHPLLIAAGADWSISRLTGIFGHAFSFSIKIGDGAVWQQANIDWWLLWDMITHIGCEFQEFQVVRNGKQPIPAPKEFQDIKDQTWKKVKASIDRGIPAIAWQPMTVEQQKSGVRAYGWALLVGYDETEKTYTVRHQHYTTEYTVPYDQFGSTDPVSWYCVMILAEKKPFDRTALEIKSLEHAVAFAYGTRFDFKDAPYTVDAIGFAAYELWIQALENNDVDVGFTEHSAWILWEMRENAAAYLREIADRFPEVSSRALSDAAVFYDKEIKAIVELVNICKEYESFTTSKRQEVVTILNVALDAERKAIGKIEAALAALSAEPK